MNVKDAVQTAIEHIAEIFEAEKPENIGLEEVAINESDNSWEVTIGFSRPWDHQRLGMLDDTQPLKPKRRYKVVTIDNETEEVKSIKIRENPNP